MATNDEMKAKGNDGMASTQVMLRVADMLNLRGSIEDVEPALRAAVAHELDMYMNPRKNTVQIVSGGADSQTTKDVGTVPELVPQAPVAPAQPANAEPKEELTNGSAAAQ
ncbi:hypothetical protein [Schleiferilactobacillus shenzhenensis]|uniref:hypothetical protein n=1 Tax=Schleiferilactobacillus shenzhenensis TaxID=1231337 RepID=UPI0012DF023B|nr:hypothetical protein [Schleiferilactobacillus shenzhenensis]